MAKIKYDVADVEEFEAYSGPTPKRGVYDAVVRAVDFRPSSNDNDMFEFTVIIDSNKKDQKQYNGCPLWQYYVIGDLSEEWQKRNMKAIAKAFGLKEKGTFDTDAFMKKATGMKVRVLVKNETRDEEVVAKANALLPFKGEDKPAEDEPEDEGTDASDAEDAEDEDDGEETTVEEDLAELDREGLKAYIKENKETLTKTIKVTKSMSDDDIRAAILDAWPDADEEDEEDEEDEDETTDDGLDDLDRAALKKFIKDNSLEVAVKKSMTDDDIRTAIREAQGADGDEEDGDEEDGDNEPPF